MAEINANQDLIKFIKEARKRGFDDYDIRKPLLDNGWPAVEVDKAFYAIKLELEKTKIEKKKKDPEYEYSNKICIDIDSDVLKVIEKRAKKNMLTSKEQIEDIIRRSAVTTKTQTSAGQEKLDDLLVGVFSRKRSGRKKKRS